MNNVYERLLYTTLRIECLDEYDNTISIGTGFLLARKFGKDSCKIYLVSNKHVLCTASKIKVVFSKRKENNIDLGKSVQFSISDIKSTVVVHPNPKVDIAILDFTVLFYRYRSEIFYKVVPYETLATFDEPELMVAENVYFVGYPNNRYDIKNNLPLIRTGMIASHPKLDYNGNPEFIIDAQVFPGSSGSPVYIDLTYEMIKNGQFISGKKNIKLLGIVSATMIRNNKLKSIQTGSRWLTEEILGLGIVYKSTEIKKLLDSMIYV